MAGGGSSLSAFGPKNGFGKGLEVRKPQVWNSTPNLQERITDGIIPNSVFRRGTALDGGWDLPPRKGPNTVLVGRESPDRAASGEHTVEASWEFPGLRFGLLDEVTVSPWLWARLGWGLRPGSFTEV